ncbi:hypothetical protein [Ralstonia solanacearum]|uniref:hypothetical protein n=1 Tax=Ralstonia solanacearum TaxID=305 RepID=UPI003516FDF5
MLPSVANQWGSTVKDTSLAYIVGVVELSTAASQVNSHIVAYPAAVFAAVAVRYFVLCSGIELLPRWLQAGAAKPVSRAGHATPWRRFRHWRAQPAVDAGT